jgi:UDP-glucose 4-epimerase
VGTGQGATVLEMIHAFQAASGQPISYDIAPRREGDVARSLASVEKAKRLLNWQAELNIDDMCASTWAWQSQNPDGYSS